MRTHPKACSALLLVIVGCAAAGAAPPEDAAGGRASRPLLEQLDRETRSVYARVRRGVLRVQLPPPRWLDEAATRGAARDAALDRDNPLNKYRGLDPKVREQLARRGVRGQRVAAPEGEAVARGADPRPSTEPVTDAEAGGTSGALIVVPPPRPAEAGPLPPATAPAFAPNNVGLLLDDRGYLLVPLYLEPDAAAGQPIRVATADGIVTDARFIGSDRQTNLTVLHLPASVRGGEPLRLGDEERPASGSLVLLVAPHDGSARLGLWTGEGREYGVVIGIDGKCLGFVRFGQFLGGRACRLIAEQIIRHGSVKRATLGVIITQVAADDVPPPHHAALGGRPAMRVDQVIPGSAADRAGIRVGDLLLSLAGESTRDIPTLSAAIAARSGPTEVQLLRDGEGVTATVDLQQK